MLDRKTEKEQISKEVQAILDARPRQEHSRMYSLALGESLEFEAFCFGQYRGFALYDSSEVTFSWPWHKEENPPLSLQIRMTNCSDELRMSIMSDELTRMPPTRLIRRLD